MEKIGEARNDVPAQLVGRRARGTTLLFLGDFVAARELLEGCHGLADPVHRGGGVPSADHYAMMLAYLAWTLALLGYIDQARSRLKEALSEARRLRHAHTLADVLLSACAVEIITGSPQMQRHAEELLALSTERGLPLNLGWARASYGASLTARGKGQEGLSLMSRGMAEIRATGAVAGTPGLLMMLAGAHAKLGKPVDGLNCLAEAAQIIRRTDELFREAELHRLRGDLLDATGDLSEAERSYHQALAVAKLQSAKLFELRASISLARLFCKQDKRSEARNILSRMYGWFSEGFDAPDLKEANALLDSLH
jgi:tetratricopeptide (TPR) repeat protein